MGFGRNTKNKQRCTCNGVLGTPQQVWDGNNNKDICNCASKFTENIWNTEFQPKVNNGELGDTEITSYAKINHNLCVNLTEDQKSKMDCINKNDLKACFNSNEIGYCGNVNGNITSLYASKKKEGCVCPPGTIPLNKTSSNPDEEPQQEITSTTTPSIKMISNQKQCGCNREGKRRVAGKTGLYTRYPFDNTTNPKTVTDIIKFHCSQKDQCRAISLSRDYNGKSNSKPKYYDIITTKGTKPNSDEEVKVLDTCDNKDSGKCNPGCGYITTELLTEDNLSNVLGWCYEITYDN